MKLSTLAVLLGSVFSLPQIYGLLNPGGFAKAARKFPRSEPWGFALMLASTAWFLNNLNNESISDFASYKTYMLIGFGLIGVLTCVYVRDFLAVRGLAVFLLLAAWFTLNTARWADSPYRVVLQVWAYIWVIMGMWLTISPWRLRDYLNWFTANEKRIRLGSLLRLAFGLFVVVLGLFFFK